MFGSGDMFITPQGEISGTDNIVNNSLFPESQMIDFDQSLSPTPQNGGQTPQFPNSVKTTRPEIVREEVKIVDKPQRRVIEIRVFYDDQTWETFVPAKK